MTRRRNISGRQRIRSRRRLLSLFFFCLLSFLSLKWWRRINTITARSSGLPIMLAFQNKSFCKWEYLDSKLPQQPISDWDLCCYDWVGSFWFWFLEVKIDTWSSIFVFWLIVFSVSCSMHVWVLSESCVFLVWCHVHESPSLCIATMVCIAPRLSFNE